MKAWFSKSLGDGVEAFAPSNKILEAFAPLFIAAGQPSDMAVFSRNDPETNLITVYFSPAAHALAKMFGATSCEKPSKDKRLGLLVGEQSAIRMLDSFD